MLLVFVYLRQLWIKTFGHVLNASVFFYQEALHWLIFTNIPKLQSSIETTTDGCEGDIKGRIHGPNCLRIGILHQIGAYLGDNGDRKCWCIDVEGTFRESNWRITNGLMDRNPIADMETYRVPVWRAGGEMVMPLQTLINILLLYPHSFSEPWNILGSQPFWLEMRGPEVDSLDLTCLSIIFIKIKWAVSFIPFKTACRKPQVPRGLPQSFRDHSGSFRECFLLKIASASFRSTIGLIFLAISLPRTQRELPRSM